MMIDVSSVHTYCHDCCLLSLFRQAFSLTLLPCAHSNYRTLTASRNQERKRCLVLHAYAGSILVQYQDSVLRTVFNKETVLGWVTACVVRI